MSNAMPEKGSVFRRDYLESKTKPQLEAMLKERSLPFRGKKQEQIEILLASEKGKAVQAASGPSAKVPSSSSLPTPVVASESSSGPSLVGPDAGPSLPQSPARSVSHAQSLVRSGQQGRGSPYRGCLGRNSMSGVKHEDLVELEKRIRFGYLLCSTCNFAPFQIKEGKFGRFLGCVNYPRCKGRVNLKQGIGLCRNKKLYKNQEEKLELQIILEMETRSLFRVYSESSKGQTFLYDFFKKEQDLPFQAVGVGREDWGEEDLRGLNSAVFPLDFYDTFVQKIGPQRIFSEINGHTRNFFKALLKEENLKGRENVEVLGPLKRHHLIWSSLPSYQKDGVKFLLTSTSWQKGITSIKGEGREASGKLERRFEGKLLADEMGLGKTLTTISALICLLSEQRVRGEMKREAREGKEELEAGGTGEKSALVICPASVRLSWAEELEKWGAKEFDPNSVVVIRSSNDMLESKYSARNAHLKKPKVVISSFEMARKLKKSILGWSWLACVVDESHNLSAGVGGKLSGLASALFEIIQNIPKKIFLSGTPALKSPVDMFHQIRCLSQCERMGGSGVLPFPVSFDDFKSAYQRDFLTSKGKEQIGEMRVRIDNFDESQSSLLPSSSMHPLLNLSLPSMSRQQKSLVVAESVSRGIRLHEFHLLLKSSFMLRRLKKDVLTELPPKRRTSVFIEIEKEKEFSEEVSGLVEREEVKTYEELLGIYKAEFCKSWLLEFLKKRKNKKTVIFGHHRRVLSRLEQFLNQKNLSVVKLDGLLSAEERRGLIDVFSRKSCEEEGGGEGRQPSADVALASLLATGVGISLTAADSCVFVELPKSAGLLEQAEDRLHRKGQKLRRDLDFIESFILKTQFSKENDVILQRLADFDARRWRAIERGLEEIKDACDGPHRERRGRRGRGRGVVEVEEETREKVKEEPAANQEKEDADFPQNDQMIKNEEFDEKAEQGFRLIPEGPAESSTDYLEFEPHQRSGKRKSGSGIWEVGLSMKKHKLSETSYAEKPKTPKLESSVTSCCPPSPPACGNPELGEVSLSGISWGSWVDIENRDFPGISELKESPRDVEKESLSDENVKVEVVKTDIFKTPEQADVCQSIPPESNSAKSSNFLYFPTEEANEELPLEIEDEAKKYGKKLQFSSFDEEKAAKCAEKLKRVFGFQVSQWTQRLHLFHLPFAETFVLENQEVFKIPKTFEKENLLDQVLKSCEKIVDFCRFNKLDAAINLEPFGFSVPLLKFPSLEVQTFNLKQNRKSDEGKEIAFSGKGGKEKVKLVKSSTVKQKSSLEKFLKIQEIIEVEDEKEEEEEAESIQKLEREWRNSIFVEMKKSFVDLNESLLFRWFLQNFHENHEKQFFERYFLGILCVIVSSFLKTYKSLSPFHRRMLEKKAFFLEEIEAVAGGMDFFSLSVPKRRGGGGRRGQEGFPSERQGEEGGEGGDEEGSDVFDPTVSLERYSKRGLPLVTPKDCKLAAVTLQRRSGPMQYSVYYRVGSGRYLCMTCGTEMGSAVPQEEPDMFCGGECRGSYFFKRGSSQIRWQSWAESKGHCQSCGLDICGLLMALARTQDPERRAQTLREMAPRFPLEKKKIQNALNAPQLRSGSFWQADHIKPVKLGGGECGLENLQVLCTVCHDQKTKVDKEKISARKREEAQLTAHVNIDPKGKTSKRTRRITEFFKKQSETGSQVVALESSDGVEPRSSNASTE